MLTRLLLDPFASNFMQRALIAIVVIGIFVPAVGTWIVLRRLAYLGDAMAHSLLSGVSVAYLLGLNLTLGALFGGVAMAFLVGSLAAIPYLRQDAAVGVAETILFSIGLILISLNSSRINIDLTHFLFGQITTTTVSDLLINSALAVGGLSVMVVFFDDLRSTIFDPSHARLSGVRVVFIDRLLLLLLACAIVASLQSVGLLMSVALLVTPPSIARLLTSSLAKMIFLSSAIGLGAGITGLIISYHQSTPPGATIALTLSAVLVIVAGTRTLTSTSNTLRGSQAH
jgi:ABC-type Mn2+/Zn2+ transport system permease subunit